ncbi:MAG: aldo/keto reductase [Chloroflexi bacterium HGW-Chloroflexi-6]|nr:MAG: aldo/keto reductase [Chloroflexi bacterium HGW-Chloroflexi-6]
MQTRAFGRTGHDSTIAIFGAAAFWEISQANADKVMEQVIEAKINHIDVAPSYGQAEERIGPWMPRERERFFLGCKTMERSKDGAWNEMQRSLKRLQVKSFDLYQFHAVNTFEDLDKITMNGGALEAVLDAQKAGLTKFIGITGHGADAPAIYLEALRRFDFDSILFPLNFVQMANPAYRKNAEELIAVCREKQVGTMVIKTITKGPWQNEKHTATTWYEPFEKMDEIQRAIDFALSYDVTGLCTAGDTRILPLILKACQGFTPMDEAMRETMIESGKSFEPLFS